MAKRKLIQTSSLDLIKNSDATVQNLDLVRYDKLSSVKVLTEEQLKIANFLINAVDSEQIQTLGGLAGSGKTTLISYLIKKLPNFACCAFTGKAAEVLRSKGVNASTIHSLIYNVVTKKDGTKDYFPKDSLKVQGIIVDEASMVGSSIYNDLISYGLPVIFVGDHGQLEPVGEDIYLMSKPDYCLETVHRNAGDIALFAYHLRSGKSVFSYKSDENKVKIKSKSECIEYLPKVDQIICATNSKRVILNNYVRKLKGITSEKPVVGDRVISLMNSKKLGIYNGTQATILSIVDDKLKLKVESGDKVKKITVKYDPSTFNREKHSNDGLSGHPFDYAYAITCHKAQGSEWGRVLVIEDRCSLWDHNRWAYTAASRAKDELIWVPSN